MGKKKGGVCSLKCGGAGAGIYNVGMRPGGASGPTDARMSPPPAPPDARAPSFLPAVGSGFGVRVQGYGQGSGGGGGDTLIRTSYAIAYNVAYSIAYIA